MMHIFAKTSISVYTLEANGVVTFEKAKVFAI